MSTASDLIKGSLRLLGVIASGETPAAADIADGLSALNEMISSWSTEKLLVFAEIREEFSVSAAQASRTMGVAGNFNTSKPIRILRAGVVSGDTEIPLEIINQNQWASIVNKDTTSPLPLRIYPEGTNPLETINIWPVPSGALTLVLYSWKPLAAFAASSTTVTLPEGYYRALRYNLALELAPEYGKTADPVVVAIANEAKENIKRVNIKPMYLAVDPAIMNRSSSFNILTGE